MSKLELVFTGNNGKVLKALIDERANNTALDLADNAQEALDHFAYVIGDEDLGDGDVATLMYDPDPEDVEEIEDLKTITF